MASAVAKDNFRPAMADPSKVVSARAIAAAAAALQSTRRAVKPPAECMFDLEEYKWRESERPLVAHDEFENAALIPVIDMSGPGTGSVSHPGGSGPGPGSVSHPGGSGPGPGSVSHPGGGWPAAMAAAARDWGFFQVVGHGVPDDVLRRMDAHARGFFALRPDHKRRVLRDGSSMKPMGYSCGQLGTNLTADLPWLESLQLPSSPAGIDPFASRLWPSASSAANFRKAADEFSAAMKGVALRILGALLGALRGRNDGGNGGGELVVGDGSNSVIRFNCYPPCPEPSMTLGLGLHSDPHLLTVLHQDLVGGLQICRHGRWIAVKPSRNALVVNIGDALQVLSNDVYKSVEHRAVCNSIAPRLSMAFFLNPIDKATIAPTTCDLPPLYRPFTWEEYRQHMYKHRPRGKSNLACFRV